MPFAKMQGVIARSLEQFGDRDFAGRQAHVFVHRHVALTIRVINRFVQAAWRVMLAHEAGEFHRHRGEFKTEAGRVAPGHDGSTRGRTGGVAGVALREVDTLAGDGVDIRGRDAASGDATTVERDVVEAKVVGQDDNDIRTLLIARLRTCGAGLPVHFPERGAVLAQDILHIQHHRAFAAADGDQTEPAKQHEDDQTPDDALEHFPVSLMSQIQMPANCAFSRTCWPCL